MAKHNIVTYNSASKGFETDLQDNTAQIVGSGNNVFSVQSGSTELFSVGTDNTSVTINTNLTASGDISGSGTSTGSFGRVIFTKISGDASQMTNVNEIGHVSGAAQIASRISGAFDAGFEILGDLSGSATSTGSFAKVFANHYVGDASQMTNVFVSPGTVSASKQIASQISGAFNAGFEYSGEISGSAISTGSFGKATSLKYTGDASQMTNVPITTDTVSGSAQLASRISGSFNTGFVLEGTISGSMTSTASFHTVDATSYVVTNKPSLNTPLEQTTAVSGSAQLASAISGAFDKGFEFAGEISGSATSTGSFLRLDATNFVGDATLITDLDFGTGAISGSAQIASRVSGSFNKGFRTSGSISGSVLSTGSFSRVAAKKYTGDFSAVDAPEQGYISSSAQIATQISGAFNAGFTFGGKISGSATSTGSLSHFKADIIVTEDMTVGSFTDTNLMPYQSSSFRSHTNKPHIIPYVGDQYYDTRRYVPTGSGHEYSCGSCAEFSNGYDNANGQLSIGRDGILNISFQSSSFSTAGAGVDAGKTAGAWSAGPNLITATRPNMFGTANAAVTTGGATGTGEGGTTTHVQHFNGISWRQGAVTPTTYGAAGNGQGYGTGEDDAALLRHYTSGGINKHIQYNGHAWWEMTCNSVNQRCNGAFGSQNASVMFGGQPTTTKTEEWNGHTWNVAGDVGASQGAMGAGTQNAGMAGPPNTEFYDGTAWSAGSNTGGYVGSSGQGHLSGTQNDAIGSGTSTQATWDGTSWATVVAKPQNRHQAGLAGGSGVALLAGGGSPGDSIATTLEWNNSFNTGSFLQTKKIGSNFS